MIKLVVFDIYKTILRVGPQLTVQPGQWTSLWERFFPAMEPPCSHVVFKERMEREVAREHDRAGTHGVLFPEVCWEELVLRVLPGLKSLGKEKRRDFIYRQMRLERDISLMPDAAGVLSMLSAKGIQLGVACNAQRYTFKELEIHLGDAGLSRDVFNGEFCCWSFLN